VAASSAATKRRAGVRQKVSSAGAFFVVILERRIALSMTLAQEVDVAPRLPSVEAVTPFASRSPVNRGCCSLCE